MYRMQKLARSARVRKSDDPAGLAFGCRRVSRKGVLRSLPIEAVFSSHPYSGAGKILQCRPLDVRIALRFYMWTRRLRHGPRPGPAEPGDP